MWPPTIRAPPTGTPYLPKSFWEVRKRPNFQDNWYPALKKQYDTLIANETWTLMPKPPDIFAIPSQWVLDRKLNTSGAFLAVEHAELLAATSNAPMRLSGELYSAVVHSINIRIFLVIVAVEDLDCDQFDIVAAFLQSLSYLAIRFISSNVRVSMTTSELYGLYKSLRWWYGTIIPKLK